MMNKLISFLLFYSGLVFAQTDSTYIIVLGIAQDGGYPHIGCHKQCCMKVYNGELLHKSVVSLAVVDEKTNQWWLIEATPDITAQLENFRTLTKNRFSYLPDAILLTHAHIGHYTGLMYLGREALGVHGQRVYALPRMKSFLEKNGPWSQLVELNNIHLDTMAADRPLQLSAKIHVTPFLVPHRDEYSETAGFRIRLGERTVLFIPDIDQWQRFSTSIVDLVKETDLAFLDATFYSHWELPNRDPRDIPHPLITETMSLFEKSDAATRFKILFIHFNHSNPALWEEKNKKTILNKGYRLAEEYLRY